MTIDDLLDPAHSSKPRNKLIAQVFYDIALIERYGSGIQRMIADCLKAGLPEPVFEEKFGGFAIQFRRNIFTEEYLSSLNLNTRQIKAFLFVKENKRISNKTYRELFQVSNKTAYLELSELVEKGLFGKEGAGKQVKYILKVMKK